MHSRCPYAADSPAATLGVSAPSGPFSLHVGVWALFWRGIVFGLSELAVIPLPWVAPIFIRWFTERIELPGGQRIGFVGKAPGKYQLWLGGDVSGTRLNRVYKDVIKEAELEAELKPLLTRWRDQRVGRERFGDFATRVLLPEAAVAAAAAAEAKALAAAAAPATVAPKL